MGGADILRLKFSGLFLAVQPGPRLRQIEGHQLAGPTTEVEATGQIFKPNGNRDNLLPCLQPGMIADIFILLLNGYLIRS
jgi:hypothetical protein